MRAAGAVVVSVLQLLRARYAWRPLFFRGSTGRQMVECEAQLSPGSARLPAAASGCPTLAAQRTFYDSEAAPPGPGPRAPVVIAEIHERIREARGVANELHELLRGEITFSSLPTSNAASFIFSSTQCADPTLI